MIIVCQSLQTADLRENPPLINIEIISEYCIRFNPFIIHPPLIITSILINTFGITNFPTTALLRVVVLMYVCEIFAERSEFLQNLTLTRCVLLLFGILYYLGFVQIIKLQPLSPYLIYFAIIFFIFINTIACIKTKSKLVYLFNKGFCIDKMLQLVFNYQLVHPYGFCMLYLVYMFVNINILIYYKPIEDRHKHSRCLIQLIIVNIIIAACSFIDSFVILRLFPIFLWAIRITIIPLLYACFTIIITYLMNRIAIDNLINHRHSAHPVRRDNANAEGFIPFSGTAYKLQ